MTIFFKKKHYFVVDINIRLWYVENMMKNYDKNSIDRNAESEARALRNSGQRQNVNYNRNRVKSGNYNESIFKKIFEN